MQTINPDTIGFLMDLSANNTREWFAENKTRYEQARLNFLAFTEELIAAIKGFDNTLGSIEARECVFRIYRDVRFSHNKDPYKTNMGAYIVRGGKKSPFAGYYFHIEPNASFVSGGIYMAEPSILKKIRLDIETYADDFVAIVENKSFKNTFVNLGEEKLKRVPQGFSPDSPVAEYLKLKHITPHYPLNNSSLNNPNLFADVVDTFKKMYPLVHFINSAIEQE
jgi:uncharacterized protein (TIGR02453 family)